MVRSQVIHSNLSFLACIFSKTLKYFFLILQLPISCRNFNLCLMNPSLALIELRWNWTNYFIQNLRQEWILRATNKLLTHHGWKRQVLEKERAFVLRNITVKLVILHQSIYQSTNQSINQSIKQSMKWGNLKKKKHYLHPLEIWSHWNQFLCHFPLFPAFRPNKPINQSTN